MSSPAAWHPDPTGKHDHRWWDGNTWTEHVADAGEAKVDHLAAGESPAPPSGEPLAPGGETQRLDTSGGDATGDTGGQGSTPGTGDATAGGAAAGGAWEGTATPDQGQWQQPGDTAASGQPAWQQGQQGGYGQQGQYGQQPTWDQSGQQPAAWDQTGQYGQQASGTDGVAVAALIIGILSLLTSWFVLGGLGGIVALILGIIGLSRVKKNRSGGRGMAITGIVTGALAMVVAVVVFFVAVLGDTAVELEQCLRENPQEVCEQQFEDRIMNRFGG